MLVIKRRNVIIFFALLITAVTFALCVFSLAGGSAGADVVVTTVVLDAGHGGIDGGVTGVKTGVKESELNLKIVKVLERYLSDAGIKVVLTRKTEAGLYGVATKNLKRRDMEKRRDIIKNAKPTIVVSVHLNKFSSSSRRGAQVFYKPGDEKGKFLATCLQNSFNKDKINARDYSPLSGDYYILNCTEYPSVIAECGFLSNPEEEALLITEEYRDRIAYDLFKGIVGYLSEKSFKMQNGA